MPFTIGHVASKLSLGHLIIGLTYVGRYLGLNLKLLQKNLILVFPIWQLKKLNVFITTNQPTYMVCKLAREDKQYGIKF
jgi:hypothetical protein